MTGFGQSLGEIIFSGSLLAAAPIALVAGFLSFASPCVLPLVPGYLGYLSGMVGADSSGKAAGSRARLLWGVFGFVAGFTVVFATATMAVASIGIALFRWQEVITRVLGVLVILMGLAFMGTVPFFQRERRLHISPRAGIWGAPVLGIVFGFGWAPCIGPTLAAVQLLALDGADPVRALLLVLLYCLGLGLPFMLVALGLKSSKAMVGFLKRHRLAIMRIGGMILIVLGLALVTGLWGKLAGELQGLIDGFSTVI